ncbi:MAG: zinc-binding alcohol dehydrogenase [Chloroflexi bacterium]|nr:zinc-binding alcohol dehydrogenase [Chloroflexota bacterium]
MAMLDSRHVIVRDVGQAEVTAHTVSTDDLGPTEVVVRTRVTLISPGTELARWQGRAGFRDDWRPTYPLTDVGYANIGTVIAAGEQAGVVAGQRVYTMGNHTAVVRVDARRALCVPVPDGLLDEQAVFVRLATVSMTTLCTTVARGGDTVAVVGLGLVGNLAAQVFQTCGMVVHAFDLSPARRALAERCGLRSVHPAEAMPAFAERCRLVIEATGSATALAAAVELAADGGEIVMIGAPWGGDANSVPSSRLTRSIFLRFLRLRSGSEWEIPRQPSAPLAVSRQPTPPTPSSIHGNTVAALSWLADGRLVVAPLITHRLAPEAIQEAYTGLAERRDEHLGVILTWA